MHDLLLIIALHDLCFHLHKTYANLFIVRPRFFFYWTRFRFLRFETQKFKLLISEARVGEPLET